VTWLAVLIFVVVFIVWRFRPRPHVDEPEEFAGYRPWNEYEEYQGPHGDDGCGI
jgi:hypothetical protein